MQTSKIFSIVFAFSFVLLFSQVSHGDVWETNELTEQTGVFIPEHEFIGFFDSNGFYTVVGNVKNSENYPIIPTITITIQDDDKTITESIQYVNIMPGKELPFKFVYHEVQSTNPVLMEPQISYIRGIHNPVPVEVIYDETLVLHPDGHLTGRIINNGTETIPFVSIFAVVHGYEHETLDMGKNNEPIFDLKPGEIREFAMYPDPSIDDAVFYYSCFAPTDTSVTPVTAKKNEGEFDFRYDSGSWYSAAKFNEEGTVLTMNGYNSYPLETYANFEFPPISGEEKFDVLFNDEPIEFIQSVDEMGLWHVAFTVEPRSQGVLVISGFDKGLPPERSLVPTWLKTNAEWWATDQISDVEFLENITFLLDKGIIVAPSKQFAAVGNWEIPVWIKASAGWWAEDLISDEDFLKGIQYLVENGIIVV